MADHRHERLLPVPAAHHIQRDGGNMDIHCETTPSELSPIQSAEFELEDALEATSAGKLSIASASTFSDLCGALLTATTNVENTAAECVSMGPIGTCDQLDR